MPFTGERFAFGRERPSDSRKPFSALPVAGASLEALCHVRSICFSFGVRTGRARQDCFAQATGDANGMPLARSLRWGRVCASPHFRRLCGERVVIITNLSSGPAVNGPALALPLASRGAVLQGAPRARPNGKANACAHGKALPKTRAVGVRWVNGRCFRNKPFAPSGL